METAITKLDAGISIDAATVSALIERMEAKLQSVRDATDGIEATDKQIQAMSLEEIKLNERAVSGLVRDATEAKRDFNREWKKPQQAIVAAYDAELQHANSLHQAYKAGRKAKEDTIRAERYAELQEVYDGAMLPELAEAVPMSRFVDESKLSVAKSWSLDRAGSELLEQVAKVANDYTALTKLDLPYQDAAEIAFFRTLSLQDAINENERVAAEFERIAALKAATAPDTAEPAPSEPEPAEQAAGTDEEPVENPRTYTFTATMLPRQQHALVTWMMAQGIHGTFKEVK